MPLFLPLSLAEGGPPMLSFSSPGPTMHGYVVSVTKMQAVGPMKVDGRLRSWSLPTGDPKARQTLNVILGKSAHAAGCRSMETDIRGRGRIEVHRRWNHIQRWRVLAVNLEVPKPAFG